MELDSRERGMSLETGSDRQTCSRKVENNGQPMRNKLPPSDSVFEEAKADTQQATQPTPRAASMSSQSGRVYAIGNV